LLEGCKPVVVEFDFAAFDELPRACVVRPFLDREVYVAIRDLVFDFIIEDSLERAYNLR
jgi:hypothetical protein